MRGRKRSTRFKVLNEKARSLDLSSVIVGYCLWVCARIKIQDVHTVKTHLLPTLSVYLRINSLAPSRDLYSQRDWSGLLLWNHTAFFNEIVLLTSNFVTSWHDCTNGKHGLPSESSGMRHTGAGWLRFHLNTKLIWPITFPHIEYAFNNVHTLGEGMFN